MLHGGGLQHAAGAILAHQQQLAAVQGAQAGGVGVAQLQCWAGSQMAEAVGQRGGLGCGG